MFHEGNITLQVSFYRTVMGQNGDFCITVGGDLARQIPIDGSHDNQADIVLLGFFSDLGQSGRVRCDPRLCLDSIDDLQIEILGEVTPGGVVLDESCTFERCQSSFPIRDFLIQLLKVLRTPLFEFFVVLRVFIAQAFDDVGNDLPPSNRRQVVVRVTLQVKVGTVLAGCCRRYVKGLNPCRTVDDG